MARKPVDLGDGVLFEKKGDAATHFREMLNRYPRGARVGPGDEAQLRRLLRHHPDFDAKTAAGVAGFKVDAAPNENFGPRTQCFWIIPDNGPAVDFSIKECLKSF